VGIVGMIGIINHVFHLRIVVRFRCPVAVLAGCMHDFLQRGTARPFKRGLRDREKIGPYVDIMVIFSNSAWNSI
jgi:hypothetical protein